MKVVAKGSLVGAAAAAVVVVPAVLLAVLSRGTPQSDLKPSTAPSAAALSAWQAASPATPVVNPGMPARLTIPAIQVDAGVEYVGLTAQGDMDVPTGPDDVGWYQPGTRPGAVGSAVLAGHYGTWEDGRGSVFDDLSKLRAGDRVFVQDEAGERISFVVRESRRFDPEADATDVFTSNDGKAHLNLITCEGDWSESAQSYSQRLVVFTDRE